MKLPQCLEAASRRAAGKTATFAGSGPKLSIVSPTELRFAVGGSQRNRECAEMKAFPRKIGLIQELARATFAFRGSSCDLRCAPA
jgi:hypothetical protein